jgi:hypothetical protein
LRHLSHAEPIIAVDHYRLAPGDYLAIEKKLDWLVYLTIKLND